MGLIGESGSGKSVTGLSIAGVHRPPDWQVSGSVSMDGVPVPLGNEDDMRRLRGEDICFVMQNPMSAFDPLFTIREHFQETREAHGKKGADVDQIAIPLLERIHIRDPKQVLKSYPFECSGGMLQRIMIAIAVMNQPKLLIADEPTTALDRTVQYEIIRLLGELKGSGSAILFISHDLKAVSYIADEIAVMYGGYIVETGSVHEIMEHPQHPYTRALISATPSYCKEVLPVLKLQRICIARALAAKPDVILLDEPLSSLDVSVQAQVLNLLRSIKEETGVSYVIISHDMEAIYYLADALVVMYAGQIVETLPDIQQIRTLCHPYSRHLLLPFEARGEIENTGMTADGFATEHSGCPYVPRCPVANEACKTEKIPFREVLPGHFVCCRNDLRMDEAIL